MGIIFQKTLKCERCGYVYRGKSGGHVISNGEHYDVAQYCCNSCGNIIDLEHYSSLKENIERYIYPDGTEALYSITKKGEKLESENTAASYSGVQDDLPPLCPSCGKHLNKLNLENNEYAHCPKCGKKSLKQKEIHVSAYVD